MITYKFKLKVNSTQRKTLTGYINTCRAIYNVALEQRIAAYKCGKSENFVTQCRQLTDLRAEFDWIREVPVDAEQAVLERLESAYKSFFKGAGFPKFAKKKDFNSIVFKSLKVLDGAVILPKIGKIRMFHSRPVLGIVKRAIVTREGDNFFVCIVSDYSPDKLPANDNQVGVDMGISFYLSTDQGAQIENPRFLQHTLKKLRREQRSLSRKKKGSNNWHKQVKMVSKLYKKATNQRKDFIHKLTTKLIQENGFIASENLNVKGMVKSRLARQISDAAWGTFFAQLRYKSEWYGRTFVQVNPAYTSQTCNSCGHTAKENRVSQSLFKCVSCGHTANADVNGALNILERGQSLFAS